MELTASEVYELVKGWPDEARPKQLEFLRKQWRPTNYLRNDPPLFDFHAADLHALAGLRWLAQVDVVEVQFDHESDWLVCLWTEAKGVAVRESQHPGPTLLHAVSDAVMAVKG
jgi:hypothetical protein